MGDTLTLLDFIRAADEHDMIQPLMVDLMRQRTVTVGAPALEVAVGITTRQQDRIATRHESVTRQQVSGAGAVVIGNMQHRSRRRRRNTAGSQLGAATSDAVHGVG